MHDETPRLASASRAWVSERPRPLLLFATLVALVATTGSLYLSLGLGLVPCRLCWYQRILMYPLVVVLGMAVVDGRRAVYRTVLPLSVAGGAIAAYHSLLQLSAATGSQCTLGGGGCGTVLYEIYGFSIPNLSLIAFVLITVAMLVLAVRPAQ
ncbi:disulfide bond formation protein B [Halorhabdus sp. CBA1104]|uniref:disulfide bond formation protein B n=1 Tax=unclassified Halorhabdus TaxID=2621901 RepID=UPI0012B30A41|nr:MULTISPECIES: disulfide bond formation protein B [unclassified Halorhabdus]QGN07165.1 disulfide bond formation protein B [Halorhabdus sp. CBA1104]